MARDITKYVYAKYIMKEVDTLLFQSCEGCQHNWMSQRHHECCYYGDDAWNEMDSVNKYFTDASYRVSHSEVSNVVEKACAMCNINIHDQSLFGLINLCEFLHLCNYQWEDNRQECINAIHDILTVPMMVMCNLVIDDLTETTDL